MGKQDLLDKWSLKTLDLDEVAAEVKKIAKRNYVEVEDAQAVRLADMIMQIYYKYHQPDRVIGHVARALIRNDFYGFFRRADILNAKAAVVYHEYFYNWAPENWRARCR